jgi:hypothetical protein
VHNTKSGFEPPSSLFKRRLSITAAFWHPRIYPDSFGHLHWAYNLWLEMLFDLMFCGCAVNNFIWSENANQTMVYK